VTSFPGKSRGKIPPFNEATASCQFIRANTGVVTQINVFTVTPERQAELVSLLEKAIEIAREVPGWISASVHKSYDGTQVTNYAQSTSHESWDLMMDKLFKAGIIEKLNEIATPAPKLYECVFTVEAPDAGCYRFAKTLVKLLVFGASGATGQRIVAEADRRGHEVVAFIRGEPGDATRRGRSSGAMQHRQRTSMLQLPRAVTL
jgi:hypothetical protein